MGFSFEKLTGGSARSKKDFNRYMDMARGSIFECVGILGAAQIRSI